MSNLTNFNNKKNIHLLRILVIFIAVIKLDRCKEIQPKTNNVCGITKTAVKANRITHTNTPTRAY